MLRHPRFLQVMHRLALIGALLMLVAPVLSRWLQAQPVEVLSSAPLCTSHGLRAAVALAAGSLSRELGVSGMTMGTVDLPHPHAGMPADAHDGMACDYCLLAARLLPSVAVLWLLPLLGWAVRPCAPAPTLPRATTAWAAHAARGPPARLAG